jgi:GDP/UDP-N,N'-diacetylbacillosamine 2-epimerase (hydrolysing)
MKKICFVTGSRAEYGLLKNLMCSVRKKKNYKLQLIVSCMHLSKKFGNTINEIKIDGFKINIKVNLNINADKPNDICKYVGIGIKKFSDAYSKLKPNYIAVLGDRFEIFSAATAALIHNIPIIHLHGGELTESLFDDAFRHSITKMSTYHFVANKVYHKRVKQLGENPNNIFNVGGMGVDSIKKTKILNKKDIEKKLKFKFLLKNLLITYHPETLSKKETKKGIENLLKSLKNLKNTRLIFTASNADTYGDYINKKIKTFVKNNKNAYFFYSLGSVNYYSCLKYIDAVVGNSSSGIAEVPIFKKFTINIGNRQKGRLKAKSILDCSTNLIDIKRCLKFIYLPQSKKILTKTISLYGNGNATDKILEKLDDLIKKRKNIPKKFFDIKI